MSLQKITLLFTSILLVLLFLALAFFNAGSIEFGNEGYVSSVHITDAEPVLWTRLGLQLHYAPEDEKIAKQFLEKTALNCKRQNAHALLNQPVCA